MERSANFIAFAHPTRAPRKLRFVREGRRGIHATGGVWGEPDWFETVCPDAATLLPSLKQRIADYLAQGFTISSERVHDKAFALALGRALAARPKSLAREKKQEKARGRVRGEAALVGTPRTVEALAENVKAIKAAFLRPLGKDLRARLRRRLDECYERLVRLAEGSGSDAAKARRALPPSLRPR